MYVNFILSQSSTEQKRVSLAISRKRNCFWFYSQCVLFKLSNSSNQKPPNSRTYAYAESSSDESNSNDVFTNGLDLTEVSKNFDLS